MKSALKIVGLILSIGVFASGCCSYTVLKDSKRRIAYRRAMAEGDEAVLRAVRLGEDGIGLGMDIGNFDALLEQPYTQFGALVLDAIMIYGSYEGIQKLKDDKDDKDKDDRPIIQIIVNGEEVNINAND